MSAGDAALWKVIGWDTFAGEEYPISQHETEGEARLAAQSYLRKLERDQPTVSSGGQDGIQDQVFVAGPGVRYRVRPD
jgi:hypothetical protein